MPIDLYGIMAILRLRRLTANAARGVVAFFTSGPGGYGLAEYGWPAVYPGRTNKSRNHKPKTIIFFFLANEKA